jgi:hypothetical protein
VKQIIDRLEQVERRYDPDDEVVASSEECLSPPGSLVLPAFKNGGADEPRFDVVRFPGGVVCARITEDMMSNVDFDEDTASPSRNAAGTSVDDSASTYADATKEWVFNPVDDFGLDADVLYGIWFSFRYDGEGELHLESQSDNAVGDDEIVQGGGTRHPNSGTTPATLEWADATAQTAEYPRLAYYGLFPVGGSDAYGDFPFQYGSTDGGMAFKVGETITLRAFSPDGTPSVFLDHLVFMPLNPMGTVEINGGQSVNFTTSALEVIGYYVNSGQPVTVTEPTDYGSIFSGASAVDDSQVVASGWVPAAHVTIAGHDESDIAGLFTAVGGVHVYVLCRGVISDGGYDSAAGRPAAHVTCFTGANPIADIMPPVQGAWVWAYAGKMPLGDGPQGSLGLVQWINDFENFPQSVGFPVDQDSVRTSFVAYLPFAPCEAAGGNAGP